MTAITEAAPTQPTPWLLTPALPSGRGMDCLDLLMERLFAKIGSTKQESSALAARRDILLPRFVSGKLRAEALNGRG